MPLGTLLWATFGTAAVALSIYAIATRWTEVKHGLSSIGPARAAGSVPLLLLALLCGMFSWRAVLKNLGSPLPAIDGGRIYFVGQLGKYIPGSVLPILAQMQLGRKYGIPRKRSAVALVSAILVGLITAIIVISVAVPWMTERHHVELRWLLLAVPFALALLNPTAMWAILGRIPLLKFEDRMGPALSVRNLGAPLAWAAVSWVFYGLHVFLLAGAFHASGGGSLFVVSLGGYALAWCAGMIAFMLPAGAGARDVTLVFALSTQLPVGAAVAVAVVSRALATAGDLGLAALSAVELRSKRSVALVSTVEEEQQAALARV
jgi:hypothetical protein